MRPVKKPVIYEELTYRLIGIAFEVHKELGSVHKENVYQNAFCLELSSLGIPFQKEQALEVSFKGKKVGVYKPDIVVDGKVVIEIKALPVLFQDAESQLSYYLKGSNFRVGLLLNFGSPKLQIKRRIYGWSEAHTLIVKSNEQV
ncbi:GxxExxY protein [Candidatus Shapirobacteria bacterium]|nr:GxxExxY protein [Candidatus Shapirobacteria bacterium]